MYKINLLLFLLSAGLFAQEKNETKEYSIEQFYENIRIGGGSFSEDETKLLISSDKSGIFNLYEINITSGVQTPITRSEKESFLP